MTSYEAFLYHIIPADVNEDRQRAGNTIAATRCNIHHQFPLQTVQRRCNGYKGLF